MSLETLSPLQEIERLRAALAERDARKEALRRANDELRKQNEELRQQLALLQQEVKRLLRGRGGAHLIDEGQLTLFDSELPALVEEVPADATPEHANEAPDGETPDDPIKTRHKPKRRARKVDASALPREQVYHELPEGERVCPNTGVPLVPIGEKIFEEIGYTPAKLSVIEHHQVKYGPAPEVAEERKIDTIVTPLPPRALEDCTASSGLLAQILVQKYEFHLPLYRQEEVFQQAGLWIPRQSMCDWVLKCAFELRPIADELLRLILEGPVVGLDDTPLKCRGEKGSGYFQSYLWTFVNPEVCGVAFRFTPGRSAEYLQEYLAGAAASFLLGDGYKGNSAAAREAGLEVDLAGCWAHVLRAFRDAQKEGGQLARLFQDDIRELYAIEKEADELELAPPDRLELRRTRAGPVLVRILRRTLGWKELFSSSGKMGKAIKYLRNNRQALQCFLRDGRVPIDNNACERSIRPVAIGRKNFLFAGSERGGEAAAIMYTVIESCRCADVDRWEYLHDVLDRVATHPAHRIAELLPSEWAKLRTPELAN
jgi:transposase